jgi:hypothetical protein
MQNNLEREFAQLSGIETIYQLLYSKKFVMQYNKNNL